MPQEDVADGAHGAALRRRSQGAAAVQRGGDEGAMQLLGWPGASRRRLAALLVRLPVDCATEKNLTQTRRPSRLRTLKPHTSHGCPNLV